MILLFAAAGWSTANDVPTLIRRADAFAAAGNFEGARGLYERALAAGARFDDDLPHTRILGNVYLHSTPPDLANAITWFRRAVELEPRDDGLRARLARALLQHSELPEAIENYRVLADAHPQSAEYVIGLATALREAGQSYAALRLLEMTVARFPNLVPVRVEYARMLNFNKQFPEAKRQFAAVLAGDPGNLIAQVGTAKATSFAGDQESAIPMYDRILRRHPGLYDAIVGKAFALLWAGRPQEARPLLAQGLRMHPEDSEVREALHDLPTVLGSFEKGQGLASKRGNNTIRRASGPAARASDRTPSSTASARPVRNPASGIRQPLWRSWAVLILAVLAAAIAGGAIIRMAWRTYKEPERGTGATSRTAPQNADLAIAELPSAPPPKPHAEAPVGNEPMRPRLKAVLIGGPESLIELEARGLANVEVRREYKWEAAVTRLLHSSADLLVLNPMTDDGWTNSRMLGWLETNQPCLLGRTLTIFCTGDDSMPDPRSQCLQQPFSARQWRDAVVAVLQAGCEASLLPEAAVRDIPHQWHG